MFRYIGNKTKLAPQIVQKIQETVGPDSTIVDLMAGTGSMSLEFRKTGFRVIANDVMTYSKHHLVVQLLLNSPIPFNVFPSETGQNTYQEVLDYLNGLTPVEGYFFNEFSPDGVPGNGSSPRKYFTSENAKKIDAIREQINAWISAGLLNPNQESLLKHTLIMAANQVANISGTYGYFLSKFSDSSKEPIKLVPADFCSQGRIDNVVLQGYAEDLAPTITADACYIDPPYMKRQYAANYHILETLARGDFPEAVGKSGLRNWWDQYSCFCTKTRIFASFEKVFTMNCPVFFISYSEDGLIPVAELSEFFKKFGTVTVNQIKYKRFRSNQSPLSKELYEYLIEVRRG